MGRRLGIVALTSVLGACGLIAGIEDIPEGSGPQGDGGPVGDIGARDGGAAFDGPVVGPDGSVPLPNCEAQRVVHLVAATGGLAWFQLMWPVPLVVTANNVAYAIDDPLRFTSVGTAAHPLYMRAREGKPFWVGTGTSPLPSVFVAGRNETHTVAPTSTITVMGKNAIAYGAGVQRSLAPKVLAMTFADAPFGIAPNAPTPVNVADVKAAVTALAAMGIPEARLVPNPATHATWYAAGAPPKTTALADHLLFAANAFKEGALGTVVIPALRDDPHGAFTNGEATAAANDLAGVLAGFYAELANSFEVSCGHDGKRLSLADNVMMVVVTGDTPKDPFARNGWPDGTPGNSNLLYVRGNGYLQPGWFGQLAPATRSNFSPTTGAPSADLAADSTAAAVNGVVYAISRGNAALVTAFDASPYAGVRAPTP